MLATALALMLALPVGHSALTTLRGNTLVLLFLAGVAPSHLARLYNGSRPR